MLEGNKPVFEILYRDRESIKIYANGLVEGAEGHCGISNAIPILADAILNGPEIPGESIVERYRRICAPIQLRYSKSWGEQDA